jgi:glycerol kinase
LLDIFDVPSLDILPEIKDSASRFGLTKGLSFLPDGIPITGILGDQQAALAGQACFSKGSAKCTYGTGAFLLVNQGHEPVLSQNGLLTTVAWSLGGKLTYAFEGSAFIAGASMQFLRDQLGFLTSAKDSEKMASSVTAAPELYFVPSLAGLGAPYWDSYAKGAFLGLTRGTTKEQLVRAGLEGVAFQVCDLINAVNSQLGTAVSSLKVDGGACSNDLLMQLQSDFAQLEIDRPKNLETTAFGAALMAGLGVGLYQNLKEVAAARITDHLFEPSRNADSIKNQKQALAGWRKAVKSVQVFAEQ